MSSGIYKITCLANNKIYIGSATDLDGRWKLHIDNARSSRNNVQVVTKAIRRHGEHNFKLEILEYCPREMLIEREQYYLDTYKPFIRTGRGYNVREKADSNLGIQLREETRLKMSKASKGRKKSEKTKEKMKQVWHQNRGEDYYNTLSKRMKGENNPATRPDVREKISKSMTGKTWKHDAERVEKHRSARLGKKRSDETRKRMSIAQQKNNTRSKEAKENLYLAQRNLYKVYSPEGEIIEIYSRELREYCKENNLHYSNLISTANNKKLYKGWYVERLS